MTQLMLGQDDYVDDYFIHGNKLPIIRNPNHHLKAMQRPFIAWDGEGYTDEYGFHHYWLLANSLGDKVVAAPGRSLERWNTARLFHDVQARYPDAIHVGFALGYDFTMLLRGNGLTDRQRSTLAVSNKMIADGYNWRLMMGKQLTTYADSAERKGARFNLQDTWGFFQRSFVNALDEYFDKDWPYRDVIVEMKQKRSLFDRTQDAEVMVYNDYELELMVMLMEELRDRLYQAGMPVSRWYGPGALANGLMQQWKIKDKMDNLYESAPNIAAAAQHAYAGGRFELLKPGHIAGKVYQYDINSAYPFALSEVPNLKDGVWTHYDTVDLDSLSKFSIVRLRWTSDLESTYDHRNATSILELYPRAIPFPFFRRDKKGNISYPSSGIHGWYWLPEVRAAINYCNTLPESFGFKFEIEEAYEYQPVTTDKPYSIIRTLYTNRQKLKAAGNGAHIGIKLGLNSLYGKFAQQIGYDARTGKIPAYHNLAIAGYVTSVCRAMMIDAMALDPTAVIAFETDGIFSTRPLPLNVGKGLGEWDLTEWDDMYYYQSGFRFGMIDGEVKKASTRGIPAKDISLERMQDEITNMFSTVTVSQTQFITLGQAWAWRKPNLIGQWKTGPKVLAVMNENINGKRIHDPDCPLCDIVYDAREPDLPIRRYRWEEPHFTIPKSGNEGTLSCPHPVLWTEFAEKEKNEIEIDLETLFSEE